MKRNLVLAISFLLLAHGHVFAQQHLAQKTKQPLSPELELVKAQNILSGLKKKFASLQENTSRFYCRFGKTNQRRRRFPIINL